MAQPHPEATLTNLDGDEPENPDDADRHNRMIDWERGANPVVVAIEFEVENVEELRLDNLPRMAPRYSIELRSAPGMDFKAEHEAVFKWECSKTLVFYSRLWDELNLPGTKAP
jgi:hypothetical protein